MENSRVSALKPGDSWKNTLLIRQSLGNQPLDLVSTYRGRSTHGGASLDQIEVTGTLDFGDMVKAVASRGLKIKVASQDNHGTQWFDSGRGIPVSMENSQHTHLDITASGGGGPARTIDDDDDHGFGCARKITCAFGSNTLLSGGEAEAFGEPMKTYGFDIALKEVTEITDDLADALFQAGCSDGTPASVGGVAWVHFDREASSLEDAIHSAVSQITAAGGIVSKIELDAGSAVALARRILWCRAVTSSLDRDKLSPERARLCQPL